MPILLVGTPTAPPVALRTIEQELARRVGPFHRLTAASGVAPVRVHTNALQSLMDLRGYVGLWLLRRGRYADGTAVAGFAPDDRQRIVQTYDPGAGALEVDRTWTTPPVAGEEFELMLLDPENELRHAVRRGLERCWFADRVRIVPTTEAAERALTAEHFWLTKPTQLLALETHDGTVEHAPNPVEWWRRFSEAGNQHVVSDDAFPDTLYVTALRPHSSWVNGADSATGPTDDDDTVQCDLDYAVTAGHKYLWEHLGDRLVPVARLGMKAGREAVEDGWRRWKATVPRPPDRIQLPYASRY